MIFTSDKVTSVNQLQNQLMSYQKIVIYSK